MHRIPLLKLLKNYQPYNQHERTMWFRMLNFVRSEPRCFERDCASGHVTGSAWVVSSDGSRVLLMHHRKLGKWLQPGGHADGHWDIPEVALREAHEETGLTKLEVEREKIFDVDVHYIPGRGSEQAHYHYDVRFVVRAAADAQCVKNEEATELRWVELERVAHLTREESVLRMQDKWENRCDSAPLRGVRI